MGNIKLRQERLFDFIKYFYCIVSEPVGLDLGETKIIGGYRQAEGHSFRPYAYTDQESLAQMIKESRLVLLLKIMVYEKPPISKRER